MMTSPSTKETARQILGKAIRFFREQRRLSQRDIADRVGVSIGDYDDWERGKHAPPAERWARLCKMLHDDLAGMRATWQRAVNEDTGEREAARLARIPPTGPLTSKPFAGLDKIVTQPPASTPPKLQIVPPLPAEKPTLTSTTTDGTLIAVPETLVGDAFDLTEAYKMNLSLPAGWRGREAAEKRADFVVALLEREPTLTVEQIVARTRVAFGGVGVSPNTISTARKTIAAKKLREARKQEVAAAAPPSPRIEESKPVPNDKPRTEPPPPVNPLTANVETAMQLILDTIPNLATFTMSVTETGEVKSTYTTREVKVVEQTGTVTIRKKDGP
jgi:transcriptional regulator with XRE-family HTH domain